MRTTLDIDDEVLAAARRIAAARSKSVGQVVSELALQGLHARPKVATREGFPVFQVRKGARPITLDDIHRDADDA